MACPAVCTVNSKQSCSSLLLPTQQILPALGLKKMYLELLTYQKLQEEKLQKKSKLKGLLLKNKTKQKSSTLDS